MSLRVLEHYVSVQGEGPRTGTMTQFVRFAGCNLRCPGWPCDTPQAIFPIQYKGKYESHSPSELYNNIMQLVDETGAMNICFTGGEPFIQKPELMDALLHLCISHYLEVEVFTNGTQELRERWLHQAGINMDWKLSGSGEGQSSPNIRWENASHLKMTDMIKFVIRDELDFKEAMDITPHLMDWTSAQLWAGVAFGHMREKDLVELIKTNILPWKLNVQVHKYIWAPEARYV